MIVFCMLLLVFIFVSSAKGKNQMQEVVEARQIAMYLSKKFTKSSLKTIGLHFGGRDHSTVIHAITAIEERASTSPKHQRILRELEQKIELATL